MGTLANETTKSQCRAIRKHLLEHGEIDKPTALSICDCERLGARIFDIRHDPKDPMSIRTERRTKTNRYGHYVSYAVYVLEEGEPA